MSDYETKQKKRNIIVGTFVFVGICALVWLIFKFGDLPMIVSGWRSYEVRVQFSSAPGVEESTPVRFCGYQIGTVVDVMPPSVIENLKTGEKYHQTVVVLAIEKKYSNLPGDVEVKLMSRGLGSSYIELRAGAGSEEHVGVLTDGRLLQGATGLSSDFFPEESQKKLEELVNKFSTLLGNANEIVGSETNKDNVTTILANLSEATREITKAIKGFQKFSEVGTSASEEMAKTVSEIRVMLEKINSGQGSVGRLLNDGQLYENLLENTQQLQLLLEEFHLLVEKLKEKGISLL